MRVAWALGCVALFAIYAAQAADSKIEDFYGRWIGSGQATGGGDSAAATQARDSEVIIERAADGFKISWTTMSSDLADATRSRVRSSELTFKRGKTPGLFIDVKSGHALDGKKTTWARVAGDTLSITQLVVAEDGQWDVTVYDRALKGGDEMTLAFTRITNGAIARQASVVMVRARN